MAAWPWDMKRQHVLSRFLYGTSGNWSSLLGSGTAQTPRENSVLCGPKWSPSNAILLFPVQPLPEITFYFFCILVVRFKISYLEQGSSTLARFSVFWGPLRSRTRAGWIFPFEDSSYHLSQECESTYSLIYANRLNTAYESVPLVPCSLVTLHSVYFWVRLAGVGRDFCRSLL